MKCRYYHQSRATGAAPLCLGSAIGFEPSAKDLDYCTTERHRWCPLYRNASRDLSLAVQQEVIRAIG
jgi:hypothetical protein